MIKKFEILLIILSTVLGLYFLYNNNYDLNALSQAILVISYFLAVSVVVYFYYNIENSISIPLFALSNIYFLICYLGTFFFDKNIIYSNYSKEDFEYAISIFFIGYLSFLIGYLIIIKIFKNYKRKGVDFFYIQNHEIFLLGVIILSLNIFFYYIIEIQYIYPYLSQIKYPTLGLGLGLLTLYISANTNKFFHIKNILSIFLLSTPLFLELLSGSYNFPFLNIFLIFLFYSYFKKKLSYVPIFLIFIFFLFFSLGKPMYRDISWSNSFNQSFESKVAAFMKVYKDIIFNGSNHWKTNHLCVNTSIGSDVDKYCKRFIDYRVVRRVFHSLESLIIVTKFTKHKDEIDKNSNEVEFWNGYSYKILSSKIIPRLFWKDKPSDTLGNEFGHRYGVLFKGDSNRKLKKDVTTSWNMPILNEFYVNFGTMGVTIGMLFIGFLFGVMTKFFSFKNPKNIEAVFAFFLILPLFFLESHLSLLLGAIFQSYVFLAVISYVLLLILRKTILVLK